MFRTFLGDSAVYGVAGVLSRAITVLLLPLYARVLTPTDFGALDILTIFGALVALTVALEISQALPRYHADARGAAERTAYASSAFWFTVVALLGFAALALVFSRSLAALLLESAAWQPTVQVAAVSIAATGVFYLLQNQLRWQLQPRDYAVVSVVYAAVTGGLGALLVVHFRTGVAGILWGQLAGAVIGGTLAWYYSRTTWALHFDLGKCREMLVFSLPLVPSSLAVFVSMYVDRVSIKYFMTLADVGVYGIGFRFASVVGILMVAFQGALMPLVYKHHASGDTPAALARIFRFFLIVAVLLVAGLMLFADELVLVFATARYAAAAPVVSLLACGILLANMYIFAPGLAIAKETRMIAAISVTGALLNGLLNVAFIPVLGIVGAALATLLGALATFTIHMAMSQRFYPVPHDWWRIGQAAALAAGSVVVARSVLPSVLAPAAVIGKSAALLLAAGGTAWILRERANIREAARSTAATEVNALAVKGPARRGSSL